MISGAYFMNSLPHLNNSPTFSPLPFLPLLEGYWATSLYIQLGSLRCVSGKWKCIMLSCSLRDQRNQLFTGRTHGYWEQCSGTIHTDHNILRKYSINSSWNLLWLKLPDCAFYFGGDVGYQGFEWQPKSSRGYAWRWRPLQRGERTGPPGLVNTNWSPFMAENNFLRYDVDNFLLFCAVLSSECLIIFQNGSPHMFIVLQGHPFCKLILLRTPMRAIKFSF